LIRQFSRAVGRIKFWDEGRREEGEGIYRNGRKSGRKEEERQGKEFIAMDGTMGGREKRGRVRNLSQWKEVWEEGRREAG
jgi:hypothetical protein